MTALRYALTLTMAFLAAPAISQTKPAAGKPADSMQVLREKLQSDKKQLIAANMDLTEAEAKAFWPIYEAYQKDLHKLNDQIATTIVAYAKEYNANSLTDAKARQLLDQSIAIDESETRLKKSYVPKLAKVLPGRKVARYMQLENKVRALVRYEIAGEVPLAP
jgi:Spy/CpxP family protein refolding chaperone